MLTFYLFRPSPKVAIINQSKTYQLQYVKSIAFEKFLDDISKEKSTKIKNLSRVNNVKINFFDTIVQPAVSTVGTIPITVNYSIPKKPSNTATLRIGIDSTYAKKFQGNLDAMVLSLVVLKLYTTTHPGINNTERDDSIRQYTKNILEQQPQPFHISEL